MESKSNSKGPLSNESGSKVQSEDQKQIMNQLQHNEQKHCVFKLQEDQIEIANKDKQLKSPSKNQQQLSRNHALQTPQSQQDNTMPAARLANPLTQPKGDEVQEIAKNVKSNKHKQSVNVGDTIEHDMNGMSTQEERAMCLARIFSTNTLINDKRVSLLPPPQAMGVAGQSNRGAKKQYYTNQINKQGKDGGNNNIENMENNASLLLKDFEERIMKEERGYLSMRRRNSADVLSIGSSFETIPNQALNLKNKFFANSKQVFNKVNSVTVNQADASITKAKPIDGGASTTQSELTNTQQTTQPASIVNNNNNNNNNNSMPSEPRKRQVMVKNVKYNATPKACGTPVAQSISQLNLFEKELEMKRNQQRLQEMYQQFYNDEEDLNDNENGDDEKSQENDEVGEDQESQGDDGGFSDEEDECAVIEQEEQLAAQLLTMQGTLYKNIIDEKKGTSEYRTRYGVVRNKKFKYYKDHTMKVMCGIFDFDRIQCVIMIDDGFQKIQGPSNIQSIKQVEDQEPEEFQEPVKFKIEVIGCKKQFIFEAPNSTSLRQWTQALYANWHASKSFKLNNASTLLNTKFWKVDLIHFKDFRKIADTGDILLFKGSSFVTKVQRAITMSEYDHVAMMLRYSNGKLVIFESTGSTGVAVLDWDIFVRNNWQTLYSKLAFRKLRYTRSLENMQRLETFIKAVIGKRYQLNASKIFSKKNEDDMENITDDKSYFCSELVASAYKCLGILPKGMAASQYWPGNFSNRGGLQLLEGAILEDEQQIEFENRSP